MTKLSENTRVFIDIQKSLTRLETQGEAIKDKQDEMHSDQKEFNHKLGKHSIKIDRLEQTGKRNKWMQTAFAIPILGLIFKFIYSFFQNG